ncbi:MAG: tol-pal system protein YbgF [Pseudomonadota bacterium]
MRIVLTALFIALLPASIASAQIVDPRVLQLEEQIRQLNGQLEELNFQMLQMQEQMRRQQEDNEFRLQQLEDQQQGSTVPVQSPGAPQTAIAAVEAPVKQDRVVPLLENNDTGLGAPPRSLGSLQVSPDGQVLGATVDFSDTSVQGAIDGEAVASIGGARNPEELYELGYKHVLNGDYALAEGIFKSFIEIYPSDKLAPDAHFWLAESMLAQGRFEDAGDTFVEVHTLYPNARKAPETLLKIGTIMAALGNRDVACATFADAIATQPTMAASVRERINVETAKVQC